MHNELRLIAGIGCLLLLAGFGWLGFVLDWLNAGQWLVQAGLLWGYICWFTMQRLPLNRLNAKAPIYAALGWGNRLTLLRGGLIAISGGFLFISLYPPDLILIPAVSYTLAAILDRLDGFAARRSQQVSLLGNELDITFDALGLVVAPLLAISLGKIHWSYLLLSVAYYVYQWALNRRRRLGLAVYPLPPNPLRRTLAGFQMGFIAMVLWPYLNPVFTLSTGIAFMLPVLFGFMIDWWIVCGRIPSKAVQILDDLRIRFFQPALRVFFVVLVLSSDINQVTFSHGVLTLPQMIQMGVILLSIGMVLTGSAGRLGALLMLLFVNWNYPETNSAAVDLLIAISSWILLLGTGRFSLWPLGDEWLARYDGA